MEIDRSNYELWLIDWLEGNLNRNQVEKLHRFLDENPDLREEFSELNMLNLKPSQESFPQKEQLKKSSSDLYNSQFEYLCIAYLENELSSEQQTELKEIITNDPEKLRIFDSIQKLKLIPGLVGYKNKKKLIRLTPAQRIIRLSAIGLSIAATITIIISINYLITRKLPDKIYDTAQNITAGDSLLKPPLTIFTDKIVKNQKQVTAAKLTNENPAVSIRKDITHLSENKVLQIARKDSSSTDSEIYEIPKAKIPVYGELGLKEKYAINKLMACNTIQPVVPSDERTKLGKFVADIIREKILKKTTLTESPLKAYEIAEAGVLGINKLFGWQMALDEKKDANGELSSIYFNSKLLKFNAPVKKSETLP